jgi:hypothetical protein
MRTREQNILACKKYYANHKREVKEKKLEKRDIALEYVNEVKSSGCVICGEKEPCVLEFHHIDPTEKEYEVSAMVYWNVNLDKIKIEIRKCVVVCRNCHAKVHAGIVHL